VVLLVDETVDFVAVFWACIRGGFTAVPLMSIGRQAFHHPSDAALHDALRRLGNPTIIVDEIFAEFTEVVHRDRKRSVVELTTLEAGRVNDIHDNVVANPTYLIPTSGSTGGPKLVAVSPDAVLSRSFVDDLNKEEKYLGTFALDSITAQNGVSLRYGSWIQMAAAALTADATSILDVIEQQQINTVVLTHFAVKQMIAAAEKTNRRWSLGSLTRIGLGGETIVPIVARRLAQFLVQHGASPDIIRAGYGTTETGFLVNGANPLHSLDDYGAVRLGGCSPGVGLRIAGDDGQVLAEGEIGEVQAKCPQKIFSFYWGDPEATRDCFTADGWWRTGDLGCLQNGELSLHGRAKEIFIVHGRKFSLAEIDRAIEVILAVGDRAFSCAIRWPEETTERLAVALVAADARPKRAAELAENIRRVVARRFGFIPSPIVLASFNDIPFGNNGKLRRSELAARVRAGMIGSIDEPARFWKPIPESSPNEVDDIEYALAQIWREVLDLHGDLDRHASFFDLGGDSLRSVMLYTAIDERLRKQISADGFFRSPTFDNLLSLVKSSNGKSPLAADGSGFSVSWPLRDDIRTKLLMSLEAWDGNRPTCDRLVAGLNTSGTKTPLFWVFQEAREFRQLAKHLGADQPIYGFRSGLGIINYEEDEIQALALRYLSEIIEACPEGPVFVGGNCQGAILALAIAQHLLRRKRHLPLLTLLEWGFPLQPYVGPVLLIFGRDSIQGNPYLRYRRPDLGWGRAFAEYAVAEIPGDHGLFFEGTNVAALSKILASHMRSAERVPPTLIPTLAHRVLIKADDIPGRMISGRTLNIAVRIRNASTIIWPAWDKSGLALGNRWLDQAGAVIKWIDGRVPLPELAPNAEARLSLPITAPSLTGLVQLSVDVVEEGNTWFNLPKTAPLRAQVEIIEQAEPIRSGPT
jgi:acyl-coenzyme A synthetase/AMP-(fatty) acid ligase/acyl carrier protein